VHFDDAVVTNLERSKLPANWRDNPSPLGLLAMGDAWVASRSSAVLEVPSDVVESESNYLLNPEHPDFASLLIEPLRPFAFDRRLLE
jgi:RES domain-containing protein